MAAPNPEKELARVRSIAKKGLPPLVVVCGPDDWFRGEAMRALARAVPADAEMLSIEGSLVRARSRSAESGESEESDARESEDSGSAAPGCPELQQLISGGLFASRTVLIVRRGANWLSAHGDAVLAIAPRIRAGSSLIVETQKLDRRTKIGKDLQRAGELFEFRSLYDAPFDRSASPLGAELVQWVIQRGKGLGLSLAPEAALALVRQVGKSPSDLLGQLELLRDQLDPADRRRTLRPSDLAGRLTSLFESNQFEFAEAVLDGDELGARRSLQALVERGLRLRDGTTADGAALFPLAASWLYQELATLHEARSALDSGTPAAELPAMFGRQRFPGPFLARVQRIDCRRSARGILALVHLQRQLRSGAEDPAVLLERFLWFWFTEAVVPEEAEMAW
ncbi:MAG: hypothetical protein Fur0037_27370 [Planctomycetota bacterium]